MCVALILALPLSLSYHLFSHLAGILEKSLENMLTFKTATYLNININTPSIEIKRDEGKCHHTVYMYTGCFSRELNYEC